MQEIIHTNIKDVPAEHKSPHEGYEYSFRPLVPYGLAEQCKVYLYEIPPGKSAYPYHYHTKNEEVFYIISGKGLLKTPAGEKEVSSGDLLFFPANENGAHKLTNTSETETLVYLDFDTDNKIDVALYPDSGKIAIWGKNLAQVYKTSQQANYYDGE
ncbi:MAG: cupin domain-containing protein [Synergistaceae bacterium]|nr:cupin domain-containing protein [Synergistaceae bacterium]